jgi:hypothetical protein
MAGASRRILLAIASSVAELFRSVPGTAPACRETRLCPEWDPVRPKEKGPSGATDLWMPDPDAWEVRVGRSGQAFSISQCAAAANLYIGGIRAGGVDQGSRAPATSRARA